MPLRDLGDADTPATFRVAGLYGSIHEAALYDYPEMTLRRCDSLAFRCDLAPLPDGTKARVAGRFVTPWRTVHLASEAVGLINSSLILNLNEPSKIGDTEWIRPMKCIGVRWPTPSESDSRTAEERYDAATEQVKRYLEFAADNRIDAVLIGRSEGREARDSARCSDCCGPYRDFDIAAIAGYARDLGIELIGCRRDGRLRFGMRAAARFGAHAVRRAGHAQPHDGFFGDAPRRLLPPAANTACVIAGGSSRRRPGTA